MDNIDLAILIELSKSPPPTVREIGFAVRRSHPWVIARVNLLVDAGYVTKPETRKARAYSLTETGRNAIKYG